jgi:hypothetical protein
LNHQTKQRGFEINKIAMTHYQIEGQTMNKDVHACLAKYAPTAKTATKKHVAGIGYVFYVKDENGNTVAQVSKVDGGYKNGEWIPTHMRVTIK